jgi:hypothetical protein
VPRLMLRPPRGRWTMHAIRTASARFGLLRANRLQVQPRPAERSAEEPAVQLWVVVAPGWCPCSFLPCCCCCCCFCVQGSLYSEHTHFRILPCSDTYVFLFIESITWVLVLVLVLDTTLALHSWIRPASSIGTPAHAHGLPGGEDPHRS